MPDPAPDEHAGVPHHPPPTPIPRRGGASQDGLVPRLGDAVGILRADVDRLAARAVAELGPVRLTAVAAAQWLVGQHQLLVHSEIRNGEEEPLALPDEGGVLAAV